MITTRIEPPVLNASFENIVMVETKANMLQAAEIWGIRLPKSLRKDEIAYAMNHCLVNETQYVWENLGQEAINMIGEIVEAGKGNCITVTHNPKCFNRLQKSLLVIGVTDDEKGECRLYMLDEVYDVFKKLTDGHMKMLTGLTEKIAQNKMKEIQAAGEAYDEGKPLHFLPALTQTPPEMPEEGQLFAYKLIRPRIMEVSLRLSAERYMVCYFLMQDGYIHAVCNWGDVLDFVWNGVERLFPGAEDYEVKRPFRKKYPAIARTFGQKVDANDNCLPEPYITTIGFEQQPKTWFINFKIYGKEFPDLAIFGPIVDEVYATVLGNFRDLCIKFFKEIMRSDAKKPKALMKEYFGFDTLPVDDDFEGLGICLDPRDSDAEEQVFDIPQGMSFEDVKAVIERLYSKK